MGLRHLGYFVLLVTVTQMCIVGSNADQPRPSPPSDVPNALRNTLGDPAINCDEIVFAVRGPGLDWTGRPGHYYANFGRFAYDTDPLNQIESEADRLYGRSGRLCRLDLRSGELSVLLADDEGGVRDPVVHYDGKKILFSYRPREADHYSLYEINIDGTGLTQLTSGPFDDLEPAYLPDGGIVFTSSRCKRWVNCWLTEVANLHRCDGDGKNIHVISSNNEHDNTPSVLPDGRVLYTRWEYVDRSQVHYHHLWTSNPDGTAQTVYFGNMHPGIVMIDAKPIPGTNKIVSSFSPGHGRSEHAGTITIVDPSMGPDEKGHATAISRGNTFRDPYPLSAELFLVAEGGRLVLMDAAGESRVVYELSEEEKETGLMCHEPAPLRARPRERVMPSRVVSNQATGHIVLADVAYGRNMSGVHPTEIKKLLVLESLPKPINFTGGMEPLSYGGTFTLERVLGTIPVEPDGSAYAELPALRSFILVALDENDMAVKRMQSFFTLQPGETTSCAGCHEHRASTPPEIHRRTLAALRRPPSQIQPIPDVPDVIDFPRDIQPMLDLHCVSCHDVGQRKGGVNLTGDRGPYYRHSYYALFARNQVVDGRNAPVSNLSPRSIGSSASPLMQKINGRHHGVAVSERERTLVRLWIETGAAAAGTYATLGSGMFGAYWANRLDRRDTEWPSMIASMDAIARRCGACHQGDLTLPTSPSDDLGKQPWIPLTPSDPRRRFSRHLVYNLTRPEKSVMLLAPLVDKCGGYASDQALEDTPAASPPHPIVFADTTDPDYQLMLTAITDAKDWLDGIKRFDMEGFRPRREYVREMQRYGILPKTLTMSDPIDYYAADRAYWQSLWYEP